MLKINQVDYFFVGPPKTGTTWIYEVLNTIEDVNLSNQTKELEFFNKNFNKGFSWYHNSFNHIGTKTCDISTSYFTSEKSMIRIKKYNQNARIIITVRHPAKRLISHYKHNIRFGIMNKIPVEEALKTHPNLIENSLYAKYIEKWMLAFGSNNVLVLPLELLSKDPEEYLNRLGTFLDVKIGLDKSRLTDLINYASQPKNYFLAKSARKIRKKINALGFHGIIKAAKKLGLKKLIYEGGRDINIEKSTVDYLKNLFKSDLSLLRNYGIPEEIIEDYTGTQNVR